MRLSKLDSHGVSTPQPKVLAGTLLVILSTLGGLLSPAAELHELPGALNGFIQSNAAMWMLACSIGFVTGVSLLWQAGHRRTKWRPTVAGRRFQSLIVYTRPDCLLCEDAVETLSEYRKWLPIPSESNIEEDPVLLQRFNESVPVVEFDGKIRFRGSVNEILLRRLIEATPPLPALHRR